MMQLDIESLRAFMAVLDHGGMTRAATHLNLGQSAVSRRIQRLEDKVGRPLLIRDGHALRPTRHGRTLLGEARTMVELHDQAVARLTSSDLTGTVKLCANGEVDLSQIASLLGTFKTRHPGAVVEFTLDTTGALVEWVDTGTIDLAVFQLISSDKRPTDIPLWSEDIVWVTAECATHDGELPIIDFGTHCYYNDAIHKVLADGGIEHRSVFSAASSTDVRAAVQAGIGVAALSSRYIGGNVVEWQPPVELAALPSVTQVIRSVPGERPEAVAALVAEIQTALTAGRSAVDGARSN